MGRVAAADGFEAGEFPDLTGYSDGLAGGAVHGGSISGDGGGFRAGAGAAGRRVEAARVLQGRVAGREQKKARMRNALVVAQMAMCVVLLAGASLCVRSLMNANAIDPGFDTKHIAMADLIPGVWVIRRRR